MSHSAPDYEPHPENPDARNHDPGMEESNTLGTLFSDLTQNVSVLVRQEVELAKTELKESATNAGKGAGMYAGAGIAAHFVLLFLSVAAWVGLGQWTGYGWSAVIVAVIWAVIAAILAVVARKQLKSVKGLPKTAQTVKKIPSAFNPKEETR